MTPVQVAALVTGLLAAAMWCLVRATRRAPRSLDVARRQMFGAENHDAGPSSWADTLAARPVSWVGARFGAGLDTIGLTAADVITRVALAAVVMAVIVLGGTVALTEIGLVPSSIAWFAVALVLAFGAAWITWRDIGRKIEQRRAALRRAANDFVQLVAVGLTTDQSVEEAIRFALDVGGGDAFEVIRIEVASAPQRGLPVWEALDHVGADYGVRELCEFATSVERQGLHGVSIGATVASMAAAMRSKALDELEREADRANANLSGPTIGFVVATVVFLAYPLAQRISEAFGG
jgi:Flp pilus assembly protein TadB